MLTYRQASGAERVVNPLKELSVKEARMIENGVKQLVVDVKMGTEKGKEFSAILKIAYL